MGTVRRARRPDSLAPAETPESLREKAPAARGQYFDVHLSLFPLGITEHLGRIQARTRVDAEAIAAERWPGKTLYVSLSCRAKRPYNHQQRRTR